VRRELGGVNICLSHEIGTLGLVERENATVLNAALTGVVTTITEALQDGLTQHGLHADTYLAQNDGTLVALEAALRFPILTIASGPANSMRGAAFLSGEEEAVVIDVGGTTADIGVLVRGFPNDSLSPVTVGGVETNFRMPDILSLRIGGGTRIEGCARSVRFSTFPRQPSRPSLPRRRDSEPDDYPGNHRKRKVVKPAGVNVAGLLVRGLAGWPGPELRVVTGAGPASPERRPSMGGDREGPGCDGQRKVGSGHRDVVWL
jgi:hypothetical protein